MNHLDEVISEFESALLRVDRIKATELFHEHSTDIAGLAAMEHVMISVLERIGDGWEHGAYSLSQVYMSGIICEDLMEGYLAGNAVRRLNAPKMAIAVLQDHHALGKRMVASILRATGYDLIDFGQGLCVGELVQLTRDEDVKILMISTLMLASALKVEAVVAQLKEAGCNTRILVGGAPFRLNTSLWEKVGADACAHTASDAIAMVAELIRKESEHELA